MSKGKQCTLGNFSASMGAVAEKELRCYALGMPTVVAVQSLFLGWYL